MDKQALDRHLTTEPDNGYHNWLEKVWDIIPEDKISSDEYSKHDDFFSFWENKLSTSARHGFPDLKFSAQVLMRKYKQFTFLKEMGWEMKSPDCWINNLYEKENKIGYHKEGMRIMDAYEYEWHLVESRKVK